MRRFKQIFISELQLARSDLNTCVNIFTDACGLYGLLHGICSSAARRSVGKLKLYNLKKT